jgi:isocitrate lyase
MSTIEADAGTDTAFDREAAEIQRYFDGPRFHGITRLYTARQVAEQRGPPAEHPPPPRGQQPTPEQNPRQGGIIKA